jgi:hypothetical protein
MSEHHFMTLLFKLLCWLTERAWLAVIISVEGISLCLKYINKTNYMRTAVPPYLRVIRSKTYRVYLKPRIISKAIYMKWYSCNKHKYGKVSLINKGYLNTNSAVKWQLMRTARTLEAERRHVLRGSVSTGANKNESTTGRFWTAGFHRVTARFPSAGVLKLMSRLFI